jgi:hypothetical protein
MLLGQMVLIEIAICGFNFPITHVDDTVVWKFILQ